MLVQRATAGARRFLEWARRAWARGRSRREEGAQSDDRRRIERLAEIGAQHLAQGEPDTAVSVLEGALEMARDVGEAALSLEILHELSIGMAAVGRFADALLAQLGALDLYDLETQGFRRAERWWLQARLMTVFGRFESADRAYRQSVPEFLALGLSRTAGRVLVEYAAFCVHLGRGEAAECAAGFADVLRVPVEVVDSQEGFAEGNRLTVVPLEAFLSTNIRQQDWARASKSTHSQEEPIDANAYVN